MRRPLGYTGCAAPYRVGRYVTSLCLGLHNCKMGIEKSAPHPRPSKTCSEE